MTASFTDQTPSTPVIAISSGLGKQLPELKQLESMLTCPICYETAVHPTSTPCHHMFCSLCIRKYLQFKQACPCCHAELHEPNLRQDKRAENFVPVFISLIERLEKVLTDGKLARPVSVVTAPLTEKENVNPNNDSKLNATLNKTITVKSSCPICKVDIPQHNFNLHVGNCKNASTTVKKEVIFQRKKPPPLPKLVFSLLKDTELRKKCKEFGLNSKGEKKLLISRLQKYTLLYNTEIMLDSPRSQLQIAMQVINLCSYIIALWLFLFISIACKVVKN